jgi:hypothetical protein
MMRVPLRAMSMGRGGGGVGDEDDLTNDLTKT